MFQFFADLGSSLWALILDTIDGEVCTWRKRGGAGRGGGKSKDASDDVKETTCTRDQTTKGTALGARANFDTALDRLPTIHQTAKLVFLEVPWTIVIVTNTPTTFSRIIGAVYRRFLISVREWYAFLAEVLLLSPNASRKEPSISKVRAVFTRRDVLLSLF